MDQEKSKPTFSIITPTRNRDGRYEKGTFARTLKSIENQTYDKDLYEHVIIDDGNPDEMTVVHELSSYIENGVDHQLIRHNEPTERYIAYNDGMRAAKNDWIVFLDDDDEYSSVYLELLADAIQRRPQYKVFNYGGLIIHKKNGWMRSREAVEFEHKIGAECESGMIVNGQFAFHKSCLEKTGYLPHTSNLWMAYDMANIPGYGSQEGQKPLGNPWGQDFYMFYQLTRHYISRHIPLLLYICYVRGSE
jgi:glycosyltransferase involved in cell wall biosynthesis